MGRKRKLTKSKEIYLNAVTKQLDRKIKDIISAKDEAIFHIDQACECLLGEFGDVLDVRLDDLNSNNANIYQVSLSSNSVDLPEKFIMPSVPNTAHKNNKGHSSSKTLGTEYKTPVTKSAPPYCITPKVNPFSPISMLRVPHQGEFAVSAAGSPLQVSCLARDTASVNIPLRNGKVMSILPKPGLDTNAIHDNLDPSVKQQLETLHSALSKILDD